MSYTVTLDSIVLNNEPMGIDESKLQIYRDTANPGIFNVFAADVTFWGDGYDILYAYYNTEDTCKTISISIIEDCVDGFKFYGVIYVDDLEINLVKCVITCSIEDDSPMGRINRYADVKVPINGGQSMSPLTDGGVALASVGSYKKTPFTSGTLPGPRANLRWFSILDLMNYICKYITDGACDVVSTYLTDTTKYYDADRWTFTIYDVGGLFPVPVLGFTFKVKINDIWGNDVFIEEDMVGLQPWVVAYNTAQRLGVKTWNIISGGPVTYFGGGENKGDRPTRAWANSAAPPNPATDPGYIYLEFPWLVNSVELVSIKNNDTNTFLTLGGLGSGADFEYNITKTTTQNYGATGFIMTSGEILRGGPENINVSFNDIAQGPLKLFNLSIKPQNNFDGTYTISLEPEPSTLNSTQAFALNDIQDLMIKRNNAFAVSALSTGLNVGNDFYLHQSVGYTADSCANESYSTSSSLAIVKYEDVFKRTSAINSETIYIAETEHPTTGDVTKVAFFQTTYSTNPTINGLTVDFTNAYSVLHPFVARNNVDKSRKGFYIEGNTVPKTNTFPWWTIPDLTIDIKNELTFEYPLTPSELNILLADPYKYILCDGRKGWIKSVEYDIKTGMTTFELLTE